MKVIQDINLDRVTIDIIGSKVSTTSAPVEPVKPTEETSITIVNQALELVEDLGGFYDNWGNPSESPFQVSIGGKQLYIDKVARIKGTQFLVLGSSGLNP